jgi:Phage tail assembly chaperone protein
MTDTNIIETEETTNLEEASASAVTMPTWDDVRKFRDEHLYAVERKYRFDSPPEMIKAYQDYKQQLRDIPQKYADLEDLRQIVWPELPNFSQNLNTTR